MKVTSIREARSRAITLDYQTMLKYNDQLKCQNRKESIKTFTQSVILMYFKHSDRIEIKDLSLRDQETNNKMPF